MSSWWAISFRCDISRSHQCNSSEDQTPVDFIYGCPIFKWFAKTPWQGTKFVAPAMALVCSNAHPALLKNYAPNDWYAVKQIHPTHEFIAQGFHCYAHHRADMMLIQSIWHVDKMRKNGMIDILIEKCSSAGNHPHTACSHIAICLCEHLTWINIARSYFLRKYSAPPVNSVLIELTY